MPTLTGLEVEWVSLVDRAAARDAVQQSEPLRLLLWKRETPAHQEASMTPEETARLAKAEADATAATARAVTAEKAASDFKAMLDAKKKKDDEAEAAKKAEDTPVDLSKADPATRAYIEKMQADQAADRVRAEKAEKTANEALAKAQASDDARLTAVFITKAEGYKALVIKADEFGPVLKEASEKLSKESFDAIETVLKAADAQVAATDLFKEQGRGGDGVQSDSAYAEVTKRAEELRKNDPKLSLGDAQTAVLKADRGLAQRLHDED